MMEKIQLLLIVKQAWNIIKTEIQTRKGLYYTYCPRFDKDGKPMIYKKGK